MPAHPKNNFVLHFLFLSILALILLITIEITEYRANTLGIAISPSYIDIRRFSTSGSYELLFKIG